MMRSLPRDYPLGRHLLADFQGVSEEHLADPNFIETALREAAYAAGATPLFGKFHQFGAGLGVTGVLLLKESHISIHTWPEYGFAAVDAFMCGDSHPERAIEVLRKALQPVVLQLKDEMRGLLEAEVIGVGEK
jgi:S-adenosylmethionine decarboxylase